MDVVAVVGRVLLMDWRNDRLVFIDKEASLIKRLFGFEQQLLNRVVFDFLLSFLDLLEAILSQDRFQGKESFAVKKGLRPKEEDLVQVL